jgi:hypothetical protein
MAETLERRWNAALERVQSLERRLAALTAEARAQGTGPNRETLLTLAHDVSRVWGDPGTDVRLEKRIVRLLIEEIIASIPDGPPPQITLVIGPGASTRSSSSPGIGRATIGIPRTGLSSTSSATSRAGSPMARSLEC